MGSATVNEETIKLDEVLFMLHRLSKEMALCSEGGSQVKV